MKCGTSPLHLSNFTVGEVRHFAASPVDCLEKRGREAWRVGGVGVGEREVRFNFRGRDVAIREPVWPNGKALSLVSRRTSVRSASALLSLLFKNGGLWTLSCDFAHTINET